MSQAETVAVRVPDPEVIRARIDQLDRESDFLRKLLRLVLRSAPQSVPQAPQPRRGPKLHEVAHGE
jgi:hypothetical protein